MASSRLTAGCGAAKSVRGSGASDVVGVRDHATEGPIAADIIRCTLAQVAQRDHRIGSTVGTGLGGGADVRAGGAWRSGGEPLLRQLRTAFAASRSERAPSPAAR
jgi:hypothetical protein